MAGDGTALVIAIPRDVLDEARAALAAEEAARNEFASNKSRGNADNLAAASLRLSQAVDPIWFAPGLPDE